MFSDSTYLQQSTYRQLCKIAQKYFAIHFDWRSARSGSFMWHPVRPPLGHFYIFTPLILLGARAKILVTWPYFQRLPRQETLSALQANCRFRCFGSGFFCAKHSSVGESCMETVLRSFKILLATLSRDCYGNALGASRYIMRFISIQAPIFHSWLIVYAQRHLDLLSGVAPSSQEP